MSPADGGYFPVPAGKKWIIRDIVWFQPSPGIVNGTAALTSDVTGCNISGFNLPPGTNSNLVEDLGRFLVIDAGDVLYCSSVSTADTAIYVSGTVLTLP